MARGAASWLCAQQGQGRAGHLPGCGSAPSRPTGRRPQTKSVRTASMVQREAPDRFLVTLMPKKLKKAMDTTLPAVVTCSCRDAAISCA